MTASQLPADGLPAGTDPNTTALNATDGDAQDPRRRRRLIVILLGLLALLLLLVVLTIWYLLFRQPVTLPGIPEAQIPHFNQSFSGLSRPLGVAVSPSGDRIYVSQTEQSRQAVMLDGSGNLLGALLPPTSTGADHAPVYVARDPIAGEVYVSDRLTGAIYIYDASGTYQRSFQPKVARPGWQPLGLTFDKAGNLYATDLGAAQQQAVEFDRTGAVVQTFGTADALNFPNGVAVDDGGHVYVTDSNNGRLLVYDQSGKLLATVGRGAGEGNLGLPRGVAVDGHGHVFVVDSSGQSVFVFGQLQAGQSHLEYLGFFGTQGQGDGQFEYPNGAAVDGAGRIFVADSSNGRVQLWNY